MDPDWWVDREKEIPYAKIIREEGIPHMELMRRIFGCQGSKPEAMYPTHKQDANNTEVDERQSVDKFVPIAVDDDGDDSNRTPTKDAHLQSQTITNESPPLSPIGPAKRSAKKQSRVTPYPSNRGKDVLRSGEKNMPRRRTAFETEMGGQFKEMMEFRRAQVEEARERREKNEATPYKEAYGVLQSIQGLTRWTDFWWACIKVLKEDLFAREMMVSSENDHDKIIFLEGYTGYDRNGDFIGNRLNNLQSCQRGPPSVNLDLNIRNTNMETHEEFNAPSHTELMSLFKEIGYEGGTKKTGCDGESSQTKTFNLED
ncbi:PREDICTED: uncharacterized protein LOC104793895 [Camelina sativa]|uniref:Uncharacterized protein LOC104704076 n=1 Tax=Camelina sativa TaxID=90675 RepID=A0ABM1QMH5_CAMSA|nr:PREDICTED: uncharacterized protein LOC104709167 [Camelina sativa]XP_019087963.1 PREDICTED: uncharacterized protein LOC104727662 [Camelina sativa]XP_019090717.1 PREDICTED: uncharacterized protein LOC104738292 [Camelina sativa]XP_019097050.1 PREDICTED: uncharacterized protein LOC104778732 [Camelina sativa]XP_019100983.1 PREDICTED: uncharacterized protein LOC104704076 [Camelina sativa]XP_019102048.1 PREDICTED: uncharacterized protein LOC104793895 [Camelina sativa]